MAGPASAGPLRTAFFDPFESLQAPSWHARATATGATWIRLSVNWAGVAPKGRSPPAGFDAADPGDPHYDWKALDAEVETATADGLEPYVGIAEAPDWAQQGPSKPYYGPVRPHAADLARFAHAIATRYGGSFDGLPRVR